MYKIASASIVLIIFCLVCWVSNLTKLIYGCDWKITGEHNPACEIVHTLGLAGPISVITVWFPVDKN